VALHSLVATSAYQPEPQSASAARHFVRQTLVSWQGSGHCQGHEDLVDDAVLLTSELVTNAVVHAGTSVHVTCRLADEAVEIAVVDHRPAQLIPDEPQEMTLPKESTNGRGLQLPAELASSWGVTYARTSKAVWFRMGLGVGESEEAARCDSSALLAAASGADAGPPPPARANLAGVGYEDLLRSVVQTARAASGADAAYLMIAGDDGEMRVRAAAGAALPKAAAGLVRLPVTALSMVTVPLVAGGRVTGILAIAGTEPDRFRERDVSRLQRLADTSAPALECARRDELDRAAQERARFLAEAEDLLMASLDRAQVLALATQLAIANLAPWCAVLLADGHAAPRLAHVSHANSARTAALDWLLRRAAVPAAPEPASSAPRARGWRWRLTLPAPADADRAGRAAGTAAARHDSDTGARAGAGSAPPGAAELAADQAWCFPLITAGRQLGLLVIGGPRGGRLPAEVAELADGLARRVAAALDRAGRMAVGDSGRAGSDLGLAAGDMPAVVLRSC
jgi:GAF domain-containing protein/anti-sigma regulatory factor (Ser/Thr protein kinase)